MLRYTRGGIMMNQEKIGAFIAKLRQEKGYTQSQLGDMLGVSYKAVSKWERGINLPDTSLYKPLCDIFEITIDELLAGEVKKESTTHFKKILLLPLFLIVILIIIFVFNNREKYPNLTIDKIDIVSNKENRLVNSSLAINNNLWYYNIEQVKVCTRNITCYNLNMALNHKQITLDELKEYYHNQYILNGIDRLMLWDGGTTIYKLDDYMVIFCNTLDGNRDIYFGSLDLENKLAGNYCGHADSKIKYFTRTYKVLNIYPDDDEYIKVTVNQFQNGIMLVSIPSSYGLEVGKTYEFTFYTYKLISDTIDNIFRECIIYSVKETDKVGLEQLQEPIYVTEDNKE